ncbi:glycoprotein hormone alpha-2 isoform X1 [Strongylocentrotus purpuratus]|uniref:Putative glycoprotein hormone-alpha2 n=1 Tax=Strongylocentrotus purpuratus TaxID=7668 RepID=C6SUP8_STRPU|nr:glycoprotein hormone alpha-2 precursor [Strongylocentrotus purpuratus]XP_011670829.1 glycoprotein hormone alpha-2 isoform X1 [Strongylocentrotus purpuratus]CAR94703.1 TPA: putative glycoprotein hormone-alpha2 [Strongylocentrotus purpuratus]|eukprot:NP_001268682.1 glycoprotein hormone alpha-2 precursor [Strongylocentrotus purpuratus]
MKVSSYMLACVLVVLLGLWLPMLTHAHYWESPGCHLVGYTKKVRIPGCRETKVQMNACRGFCQSYSYPSNLATLQNSDYTQIFTTHGSCCSIATTHDVNIRLQCLDNYEYVDTFKSAASCECSLCVIGD